MLESSYIMTQKIIPLITIVSAVSAFASTASAAESYSVEDTYYAVNVAQCPQHTLVGPPGFQFNSYIKRDPEPAIPTDSQTFKYQTSTIKLEWHPGFIGEVPPRFDLQHSYETIPALSVSRSNIPRSVEATADTYPRPQGVGDIYRLYIYSSNPYEQVSPISNLKVVGSSTSRYDGQTGVFTRSLLIGARSAITMSAAMSVETTASSSMQIATTSITPSVVQ